MTESTAFPWLKHLPEDAAREFFKELFDAFGEVSLSVMPGVQISAGDYVKILDPMIYAWKATAEVHADPEVYKALTQAQEGDFGPVLPPESPCCLDLSGQCECDAEDSDCCAKRSVCECATSDFVDAPRPEARTEKIREIAEHVAEVSKGLNERLSNQEALDAMRARTVGEICHGYWPRKGTKGISCRLDGGHNSDHRNGEFVWSDDQALAEWPKILTTPKKFPKPRDGGHENDR